MGLMRIWAAKRHGGIRRYIANGTDSSKPQPRNFICSRNTVATVVTPAAVMAEYIRASYVAWAGLER